MEETELAKRGGEVTRRIVKISGSRVWGSPRIAAARQGLRTSLQPWGAEDLDRISVQGQQKRVLLCSYEGNLEKTEKNQEEGE